MDHGQDEGGGVHKGDLGLDLAGVIAIQRKLSGLERDVAAIQTRLGTLGVESQRLRWRHTPRAEEGH